MWPSQARVLQSSLIATGLVCCVSLWLYRRRRQRIVQKPAPPESDFVFGFGSLFDDKSRLSSMSTGCRAALLVDLENCGFVRAWCFRSVTGFTAIGGKPVPKGTATPPISGVIFPAGGDLQSLDLRERGYHRVEVPRDQIRIVECERNGTCDCTAHCPGCGACLVNAFAAWLRGERHPFGAAEPRVWVYLPNAEQIKPASAGFPMCQTYIDVVLNGCLAWGGEEMAAEWCRTTEGWSNFWLNDAT